MFYQKLRSLFCNIGLVFFFYLLCRVVYYLVNKSYFLHLSVSDFMQILRGGVRYDLSSICYTNALYILLALLPLYGRVNWFQQLLKGLFVFVNSIAIIINLVDTVMFPYVNHRFTASVFTEFGHESNLLQIIGHEAV